MIGCKVSQDLWATTVCSGSELSDCLESVIVAEFVLTLRTEQIVCAVRVAAQVNVTFTLGSPWDHLGRQEERV